MKIKLTPISSKQFTIDDKDRQFIADESDLHGASLFNQIYDDAADVGFIIKSQRTGKEVTYVHFKTNRNEQGDIESWEFEPIYESKLDVPDCIGTSVIIFND